jgi:hypothetical protein
LIASGSGTDPIRPQLSADGRWWWDGRRWLAAQSADGLWHWDGGEWWTNVSIDQEDPAELANSLDRLAEEQYCQAGTILARRRREWRTPDDLAALVDEAHLLLQRLDTVETRLAVIEGQLSQGAPSIVGWLSGAAGERRDLRAEKDRLNDRLRAAAIEIGERAKRPTTKEADDILSVADRVRTLGIALSSAIAAVVAARRDHDDQARAAEEDLRLAEESRLEALRAAEEDIARASAAQREAAEAVREELARASLGEPGSPVASFDHAQLTERWIQTADGRGPAEGAQAQVATAPVLWGAHQPLLSRLLEVDSAGARAFHDAETSGRNDLFVLVITDLVKSIVACPTGQEEAALEFGQTVRKVSAQLAEARPARERRLSALRADLRARQTDRTAVEQARARLMAVESDRTLLGTIRAAKRRLEEVRADDTAVRESQHEMDRLVQHIAKPPEPLSVAPGFEGERVDESAEDPR